MGEGLGAGGHSTRRCPVNALAFCRFLSGKTIFEFWPARELFLSSGPRGSGSRPIRLGKARIKVELRLSKRSLHRRLSQLRLGLKTEPVGSPSISVTNFGLSVRQISFAAQSRPECGLSAQPCAIIE
jgi:hypothetical protein